MFEDETRATCPACGDVALAPVMSAELSMPLLWTCITCSNQISHQDLLMAQLTVEPEAAPHRFRDRILAAFRG